jgi:predicted DNA-binding antitoxin AbrB/MazE fold protein
MGKTFEAVHENGVLRPLETLAISNMEHVLVTISDVPSTAADVAGYFELKSGKRQNTTISVLDEVRPALASIPGSLADAVIASREER